MNREDLQLRIQQVVVEYASFGAHSPAICAGLPPFTAKRARGVDGNDSGIRFGAQRTSVRHQQSRSYPLSLFMRDRYQRFEK
jgi:hypothetical protein